METIQVTVRIRPLMNPTFGSRENKSSFETESCLGSLSSSQPKTTSRLDSNVILFDPSIGAANNHSYSTRRKKQFKYGFDCVFDDMCTQSQVYESTALPLLHAVFQGYNATLFAYGATGCGKTHTIVGTQQDPGIIYLTMKDLYSKIDSMSSETHFDVSLSYLEVYNENIRDLLDPGSSKNSLELREDENGVIVHGLSSHSPANAQEVLEMMMQGNERRMRAPTEANAVSSRSHAVLQVKLRQRPKITGIKSSWTSATLSIIDLAGSERASVTRNRGERLLEGANINRSLLALGNCINALASACGNKKQHIPYRDSKLTRLLKFSLSGNCKVVMIANVSPSPLHAEETHNTLKYANRAKNIRVSADKNVINVTYQLSQYPLIISNLQKEIQALKSTSQISSSDLKRLHSLFIKITDKQMQKVTIEHELKCNELRLQWAESISNVEIIEEIHNSNASLLHNLTELNVGLDRYYTTLKETQQLEQSLQMQAEVKLLELNLTVQVLEKRNQLVQTQVDAMNHLIKGILHSESLSESKALIIGKQESNLSVDVFYDSCTDVSEGESIANLSEFDSPECSTPVRHLPLIQNPPSTVKTVKKRQDVDLTPVLKNKKRPLEPIQTPKSKKLLPNKRRMSMIPQLKSKKE